jgi:hypothetical protein
MADTTANSTLTTNFNVSPYYDDYDDTKEFYRILYRPGYAVQARELTQSQTILQKQINRFGRHIFKEGTLVLDSDENRGKFTLSRIPYIKIKNTDSSNGTVNVFSYVNTVLTGATSNISARVIDALDGDGTSQNTKTLYIGWLNGNPTANLSTFIDDEVLLSNTLPSIYTASANSSGFGSIFRINEGVVFAKEHFISFQSQSIIADRYSQNANCQVGFVLSESIISSNEDISLLDPALESSNYSAPGANRFKISARLVRYDVSEQIDSSEYIKLISVKDGVVQERNQRTQYSAILDELAKRTYDESGDYYSYGLSVKIRENLDTGNNFGYLSLTNGGDSEKLTVVVEPGTGYVRGYEIGAIAPTFLTIDKSNTFSNINSQIVSTRLGNYLLCDEAVGPLIHDKVIDIYLYDTAQNRISGRKWSTGSQTGNIVGTAKLSSAYYDSGTLGTSNSQIKVYLFDIEMNGSNTISSNVKSLYSNSGSVIFSADVVLNNSNLATLEDTSIGKFLYYTGSDATRTIRDDSSNPDTTFTFRKTDSTITSTGTFAATISGGEVFPYTVGSLSDTEKKEFLLTFISPTEVSTSGVVSNTSPNGLLGVATSFNNFNVGDKIAFTNTDIGIYTITAITSGTEINVYPTLSSTVTNYAFVKKYEIGDFVDLTTKGVTGVERTVTSASTTQLNFDLKETFSNTASLSLTYNASRNSAKEATKTLKSDRYVVINCSSAGTTGPFNLGISDIFRIKEIRKHNSTFTTGTEGTDVTKFFSLLDGNYEYYVDHAKINPDKITLSSSEYLLVKLDYFDHDFTSGKGYFSIDSYPINDDNTSSSEIRTEQIPIFKSPTTGVIYDLRNHLDFRPIKTNTASDSTTIAGATENPSDIRTFKNDGVGFRLPADSSQIIFDFSYYNARKDIVYVNKNNIYSIKNGTPSSNPVAPSPIDETMTLAVLTIAPYPSLSPEYAQTIGRLDISCSQQKTLNRRYTMKDIGTIRERVDNLEYYASLNALEKDALDMQILDENGLNRFKNGIFVDSFSDHSLGDTRNPDYKISVDKQERSVTPIFNEESLYYNIVSNNSYIFSNTEIGVITLDYDEVEFLNQPYATTDRNIETSIFNYSGTLNLNPPTDVWVDTTIIPPNTINTYVTNIGTTRDNRSWTRSVTGYSLVNKETGVVIRRYDPNRTYTIYAAGAGGDTTGRNRNYYNNYWGAEGTVVSAQEFAFFEAKLIAGPDAVKNVSWYSGPNISVDIVEDYTEVRSGISGSSTSAIEENALGNFVTDVSAVTYIRPQKILINAIGLLPRTRHYVFFDGENMSDFVTPLDESEFFADLNSTAPSIRPSQSEGSSLISDDDGKIYAALRIPNTDVKKFTVGNKQVIVTDSRTNADNPTSVAVNNFYASGINTTRQGLIQSTRITTIYPPLLPEDRYGTRVRGTYGRREYSCLGYSFYINAPEGEEGIFITSVDTFFSSKHPELGVWFEIREMDSGGSITRNTIPYSEVWYESSDIVTSDDSSVPFNVKFPCPIFLKNGHQYAFIIHTAGINPGYRTYVADINAQALGSPSTTPRNIDLLTGSRYVSRPLTGTLYTTNNNLNWDIVDGIDLKVKFYRASFVKNINGVVTIGNKPIEFIKANNLSSPLTYIGEPVWVTTD